MTLGRFQRDDDLGTIGTTPVDTTISPGRHKVTFVIGADKHTFSVNVKPGETVRLVADATPDRLRVAPIPVDPEDPLARVTGVENLLEITMRDGSIFRVSGPGAGGPACVTAVYADVARLVAGERPILFRSAS